MALYDYAGALRLGKRRYQAAVMALRAAEAAVKMMKEVFGHENG